MNDHDLQMTKEPIFGRKKSLLSVGQYANRQGVSAGIVEEAARLGVVQVRKHKDKTFIVDLPLDTYKMLKQPDWGSPDNIDTSAGAAKISELVNKIFQSDSVLEKNLKKTPTMPAKHITPQAVKTQNTQQATIPDLKLFAEEEISARKAKIENPPASFRAPLLRSIIDSTMTMPKQRVNSILLAITAAVVACALTYIIVSRNIHQQKLHQAYENIGKLMTEYENAKQKAQMYEFDAMSWRTEAGRTKKTLINSESELNEIRKRLYEAKKDLQTLQSSQQQKAEELKTN